MTTTPTETVNGTRELLQRVEHQLTQFQTKSGEVVGEKQLDRERTERKASVLVAVAVMSLITIIAVLATVALLRRPGPAGAPAPTPTSAQFVSGPAGCLYRVWYRTHDGEMLTIDAKAPEGACSG